MSALVKNEETLAIIAADLGGARHRYLILREELRKLTDDPDGYIQQCPPTTASSIKLSGMTVDLPGQPVHAQALHDAIVVAINNAGTRIIQLWQQVQAMANEVLTTYEQSRQPWPPQSTGPAPPPVAPHGHSTEDVSNIK